MELHIWLYGFIVIVSLMVIASLESLMLVQLMAVTIVLIQFGLLYYYVEQVTRLQA